MHPELVHWLALTLLPGLGPVALHGLMTAGLRPSVFFSAAPPPALLYPGLSRSQQLLLADTAALGSALDTARREVDRLAEQGIAAICLEDGGYPELLRAIPDPPPVLFYRGDFHCLQQTTLAIIGSRAATSYGRRAAFDLAAALGARGVVIVSGMALGIDAEAHRGALAGGGRTAAVLGCGLDVCYPPQHRQLAEEIAQSGTVLSEYPLATRPDGFRFPARNRIIAGLSTGVVVVEAAEKSGSLITARLAMEQGREVFAVPGRIDSAKSRGCHRLLLDGAHLALSAEVILEELMLAGVCCPQGGPDAEAGRSKGLVTALDEEEQALLAHLEVYPVTIDTLVQISGLEPARIHDLLLRLELGGLVRQLPGQQYEKTG